MERKKEEKKKDARDITTHPASVGDPACITLIWKLYEMQVRTVRHGFCVLSGSG
jgi:hypothetical protein